MQGLLEGFQDIQAHRHTRRPAPVLRAANGKERTAGKFPPPESLLLSPPPLDAGGRELHPAGEASAGGEGLQEDRIFT